MRGLAMDDPRGFLGRYRGNVIIDEAQRAPHLFSYIQTAVARDDRPGRFILTGSQNFLLMQQVSDSLAGRCAILHILPFSRAELEREAQARPSGPRELLANTHSPRQCWPTVWTGFYPRIHDRKIPADVWLGDYVRTYLERDVRRLVNIGDLDTFEWFLALCAGRTGQLLNYSSLAADTGVSVDTARRWISVLKTSFIIYTLRPHHRNFNKRVIKSPKLYFYDTGLACRLLRIRSPDELFLHSTRGALFENTIISEVMKAFVHNRMDPPLHYWRDQTGHEVDLLIEDAQRLHPIEIKSGETVSRSMFEALSWWRRLAGAEAATSSLIHAGTESFSRMGVSVHPWFAV